MYYDLLTKIKNAEVAGKKIIKTPYTKMDFSIAEILLKNKYLTAVEKKGRGYKKIISLTIGDAEKISGLKFLSKSSRRVYLGYKDLKPVKQGYGISVISTSKGIMTGKEARKNKLGGEILFEIW